MLAWAVATAASAAWTAAAASSISASRLNQRRLLLAELVFQLGEEQVHEELIGLHAVADVHVELLDVGRQLGQQRRLLEGLDLARLHALQAERLPHRPGGGDAHVEVAAAVEDAASCVAAEEGE